jgi:hypothetical protein
MTKGIWGIVGLTLGAAGLQAQGGILVGGGGGGRSGPAGPFIEQFQQAGTIGGGPVGRIFTLNGNTSQTVVGRPVSGREEQKSTQTLGDGTEISTSESNQFYRDSAGRTRKEMPDGRTLIVDPVARVTVTLIADTKTARKAPMPGGADPGKPMALYSAAKSDAVVLPPNIQIATRGDSTTTVTSGSAVTSGRAGRSGARNPENTQFEELGVESLNGVLATHTRNTLTIPQGQIGNNRDIHVVNERWYSDDLQMLVKTVNSDPRFGENTYELTNISRDEPDASLFQIPLDYTVKETGPSLTFQPAPATTVNK